jgi:putative endonuclease
MTSEKRRHAWRWGQLAETIYAVYLICHGYRIVARRLRSPVGEIDILARRGNTHSIVEVKARPEIATAAAAISERQKARLIKAAEWLISGRPELANLSIRFEAMLVRPWRVPTHIVDAWRADQD